MHHGLSQHSLHSPATPPKRLHQVMCGDAGSPCNSTAEMLPSPWLHHGVLIGGEGCSFLDLHLDIAHAYGTAPPQRAMPQGGGG